MSELIISRRQLEEASAAWGSGGTLGLGAWLAKHKPHFTVKDYGELVELVRTELGDDTDYSREPADCKGALWGGLCGGEG